MIDGCDNLWRWGGGVLCLLLVAPAWAQSPTDSPYDLATLTRERSRAGEYADELTEAWRAFAQGDSPRAGRIFDAVLATDDATPADRIQALFGRGTNYAFMVPLPNKTRARAAYQQLIDEYGDHKLAAWARLRLGLLEANANTEQREKAREHYRILLRDYPTSAAIHEATMRLAASYFYELEPSLAQKGVDLLEEHLQTYPDNPLASTMHFRLTYWYAEVLRDYDNGLRHGLATAKLRICDPSRQLQVYWTIAQIYWLRQGNAQEAVTWYQKIVDSDWPSLLRQSARDMIVEIQAETQQDNASGGAAHE